MPFRCRSFGHGDDLSEVRAAAEALPRRANLLAASRGLQEGLFAHGNALFPGLRWFLVEDSERPVALIPLQRGAERSAGIPLVSVRGLSRFEMLYADAQVEDDVAVGEVARSVFGIRGEHRPDVLRVRDLPASSALLSLATALSGTRSLEAHPGTSLLGVGESGEKWLSSLSRNLRGQVRQAERRLTMTGAVACRHFVAIDELDDAFERFMTLEAAGYKQGLNPLQREFGDREVLRAALLWHAGARESLIMELWVGDELAASQFGIRCGNRFYLIKVAFNERFAEASPGTFLMAELMRHFSDSGEIEFVDCCVRQRWHDRWHPLIEEQFRANVPNTRTTSGLLLRAARAIRGALR